MYKNIKNTMRFVMFIGICAALYGCGNKPIDNEEDSIDQYANESKHIQEASLLYKFLPNPMGFDVDIRNFDNDLLSDIRSTVNDVLSSKPCVTKTVVFYGSSSNDELRKNLSNSVKHAYQKAILRSKNGGSVIMNRISALQKYKVIFTTVAIGELDDFPALYISCGDQWKFVKRD